MPNYFRFLDGICPKQAYDVASTEYGQASQMMVRSLGRNYLQRFSPALPFCIPSPYSHYCYFPATDSPAKIRLVQMPASDLVYVVTCPYQYDKQVTTRTAIGLWYESSYDAIVTVYRRDTDPITFEPYDTAVDAITIAGPHSTGTWWIPDGIWDEVLNSPTNNGNIPCTLWIDISGGPISIKWLRPPSGYVALLGSGGGQVASNPIACQPFCAELGESAFNDQYLGARTTIGELGRSNSVDSSFLSFAHPAPANNPIPFPLDRAPYFTAESGPTHAVNVYHLNGVPFTYAESVETFGDMATIYDGKRTPKVYYDAGGIVETCSHPPGSVVPFAKFERFSYGDERSFTSEKTPSVLGAYAIYYILSGYNIAETAGTARLEVFELNGSTATAVIDKAISITDGTNPDSGYGYVEVSGIEILPPSSDAMKRYFFKITTTTGTYYSTQCMLFPSITNVIEPVPGPDGVIACGGSIVASRTRTPLPPDETRVVTGLPDRWHHFDNGDELFKRFSIAGPVDAEALAVQNDFAAVTDTFMFLPSGGSLEIPIGYNEAEAIPNIKEISTAGSWVDKSPGTKFTVWKYTAAESGIHNIDASIGLPNGFTVFYSGSIEIRAWVDDPHLASVPTRYTSPRLNLLTPSGIVTSPPASPAVGNVYAIGGGATGLFDGHDGELATWHGETSDIPWTFAQGTDSQLHALGAIYVWDGSDWANAATHPSASLSVYLESGESVYVAAQVAGFGVQCLCVDTLNGSCRITAPT